MPGGVTQDEAAQRQFGMPTVDTQGPAGSRVPDLDERPRRPPKWGGEDEGDAEWRYLEDTDAPPDAVGGCPLGGWWQWWWLELLPSCPKLSCCCFCCLTPCCPMTAVPCLTSTLLPSP